MKIRAQHHDEAGSEAARQSSDASSEDQGQPGTGGYGHLRGSEFAKADSSVPLGFDCSGNFSI